jgi:uncharacterized membrane protein
MLKTNKPKTKRPRRRPHNLTSQDRPTQQVTQVAAFRSAPLPLPSELQAYEAILPGAADRIFIMVESQSSHRQGLEKRALSIEDRNSLLGIIAGWFIGVLGLLVAGFCIYTGHDVAGGTIGGVSLASLVGTFIYGTRERRIEREQKYLVEQNHRKGHQ